MVLVVMAGVLAADAAVREVKLNELPISYFEGTLLLIHLDHPCFGFLHGCIHLLYDHGGGFLPLIADDGCHAKALFLTVHCCASVQPGYDA